MRFLETSIDSILIISILSIADEAIA